MTVSLEDMTPIQRIWRNVNERIEEEKERRGKGREGNRRLNRDRGKSETTMAMRRRSGETYERGDAPMREYIDVEESKWESRELS